MIERDRKDYPSNAFAILTGNGGLHATTQCGVFKGTTKAVFVDRREYPGPLWEQIEEAFQFVLRNIHLGATFVGIYRQDIYEIPPDAIRELIINAMVHRSYLDHGTIQVAVYDNRLEITSPGKLPMGQTMERMKEGYSKIRNEALAHAFAYMNLIEHWGSGIYRQSFSRAYSKTAKDHCRKSDRNAGTVCREAWNIKKNNFQNFCGVKRTRHTRTARKQKKSKMAYYKQKIGGAAWIPTK